MPDKKVHDEIERLLNEGRCNQEIDGVRIRRYNSDYDITVLSIDKIPNNLVLDGDIVVTVWTTDYILYTEHHDVWPDRMGKARRNPP